MTCALHLIRSGKELQKIPFFQTLPFSPYTRCLHRARTTILRSVHCCNSFCIQALREKTFLNNSISMTLTRVLRFPMQCLTFRQKQLKRHGRYSSATLIRTTLYLVSRRTSAQRSVTRATLTRSLKLSVQKTKKC